MQRAQRLLKKIPELLSGFSEVPVLGGKVAAVILTAVVVLGVSVADGQTCSSIPTVSTSTNPTKTQFPYLTFGGNRLQPAGGVFDLEFAAAPSGSAPIIYGVSDFSISRTTTGSSPASISLQSFELGNRYGGPILNSCDCYSTSVTVGGAEDGTGNGRSAMNWPLSVNPWREELLATASGKLAFGQQLNPFNSQGGDNAGDPIAIAYVPATGKYFTYFGSTSGTVYRMDVSTPSGSAATAPITGVATAISGSSVGSLRTALSPSGTAYLFAAVDSSLQIASVNSSDGSVSILKSLSLPSNPNSLDVLWNSARSAFWIAASYRSGGFTIVEFNPAFPTAAAAFATSPTSSDKYVRARLAGSSAPVIFAAHGTSKVIDVFPAPAVGGSPVTLCASASIPTNGNGTGTIWLAYIAPSTPTTAYIYRTGPSTDPLEIEADTYDLSNYVQPPDSPPSPSVGHSNVSPHTVSGAPNFDTSDYVGDTFLIQDFSSPSSTITSRTWAFNYSSPFSADLSSETNAASFYAVLPCETLFETAASSASGANCSTIPASPPLSQAIAVQPTNQFGTASNSAVDSGKWTAALKQPQTRLNSAAFGTCSVASGFTGSCYSILQGASTVLDASSSQGSPSSFEWFINGSLLADSYTGSQYPFGSKGLSNGTTFTVQATYKGNYAAAAVSGTVVVAPAIPKFVVTTPSCPNPAVTCTILQNSGYAVQNLTQTNFPTPITAIWYLLDTNSANPSVDASWNPTSGFVPTSGTPNPTLGGLTAPAADQLTHYLHFRVDYTSSPSSFFEIPLAFSAVTYQPSVSIAGAFFTTQWLANTNQTLTFSDPADSAAPPAAASWTFGDGGSSNVSDFHTAATHKYTSAGNFTVTLKITGAVGPLPTATASINISNVLAPPPPPPPPPPPGGCSFILTINGPTIVQAGEPGSWQVSASGGATPTYSWLTSENTNFPTSGSTLNTTFQNASTSAYVEATGSVSGCTPATVKRLAITVTAAGPATPSAEFSVATASGGSSPQVRLAPQATSASISIGGAFFTTQWEADAGTTLSFTVSGGTASQTANWTFGDGSSGSGSATAAVTHSYSTAGTYTVRVTFGSSSASTSVKIDAGRQTPPPPPPPPSNSPTITISGSTALVVGTAGNWLAVVGNAQGTPTIAWSSSPDGGSGAGTTFSQSYSSHGNYTVTATVTASNGTTTSNTVHVTVSNPAGVDYTFTAGTTLQFTAADTSGDLTNANFVWNFGDSTPTVTGKSVQHSYVDKGLASYTVTPTLTVTRASANPPSASKSHSIALTGSPFQALAVPGAGHLDVQDPVTHQVTGSWETDLSLFNSTSSPMILDFNYVDAYLVAGVNPAKLPWTPSALRITLAPLAGATYTDVTHLSLGGGTTSVGSVFVKYSGAVPPTASAQLNFVSTDSSKPGAYGSALPVQQINGSGPVLDDIAAETQTIVGLQYNTDFRSNLTLVGAGTTAGNYSLDLIRDDGVKIGATQTLTLSQFQQAKVGLNAFLPGLDPDGHIYVAKLSPVDPNNPIPVFAFGTLIDQETQDTINLADDTPREDSSTFATYYMPNVGRIGDGGPGSWKTDLYVYNSSPNPATLFLTFQYWDGSLGIERQSNGVLGIPGGQATAVKDLITTTFPSVTGSPVGALVISYQPDSNNSQVFFQGRIYKDEGAAGTYGMQLPAFADSDGVSLNSGQIVLTGLQNDAASQAKFGFLVTGNPSQAVTVHAVAYDQINGQSIWANDYVMSASNFGHFVLQPTQTSSPSSLDPLQNRAFNIVATVTGGPSSVTVIGYGLEIDNKSTDPTFLPYRRPPSQ